MNHAEASGAARLASAPGSFRSLFIGDVNVDIVLSGLESPVTADREVFCAGFSEVLGGSTALAAAAYARLGGRAVFCGCVGDDKNGSFVADRLTAAGVDTRLLWRDRSLPTGVTVNLSYGRERSQVTCRGTLATANGISRALGSLDGFNHAHVSGPYGMPSFSADLARFFREAKVAGKTVSLDTQWDPSELWKGLVDWLPNIDVLFVNEHEAASITGERSPDLAWLALSRMTACPVVKLGAQGVIVGGVQYPAVDIPVVDTTGAGDTFAAGYLLARFGNGLGQDESVRFASGAAAVACTYPGGDDARLSADAVERLIAVGDRAMAGKPAQD